MLIPTEILTMAIAEIKLPAMMNINGGGSGTNCVGVTAMDQFIQLLTVEKLGVLTPHKAPAK